MKNDPPRTLTNPPPMLLDMRWVYENAEQKGEEQSLRNCRAMLKQSPKSFMEQMGSLERAWAAQEGAAREQLIQREKLGGMARIQEKSPSEEGPDEGTERALELVDQYLKGVGL
jgi:hypothetical protein